jgi:hypothetical protein
MQRQYQIFCALIGVAGVFASPAHATLALTPTGTTDGFTLTPFVSGYNFGGNYGPLSQGILPDGNVITGSVGDGKIYIFPNANGQTLGSAISATSYTFQTGNPNWAFATAGGNVYGAQLFGGAYESFSNTGSFTAITGQVQNYADYLGMWGDPANGHIIAASYSGLIDINPVNGNVRVINANLFPDGVSVSLDGTTAYVEVGGNIDAVSLATGDILATYSGNGHSPDGTGVIDGGLFNGFIVVNNNDGTVGLIDPSVGTESIIASGGSRGDFTSPNTATGDLFLSQYELVDTLGCGPGCSIGSVTPGVPEASTWAMILLGFAGLGYAGHRRARKRHAAVA